MYVEINVAQEQQLRSLYQWLCDEVGLRGSGLDLHRSQPLPEQMGGALEVIVIALGSSGVGAVLAKSLETWLQQRTSDVKLRLKRGEQEIEIEVSRARDSHEVIQQIKELLASNGDD